MRRPSRKRLLSGAFLLAALSGLGWLLYVFLPPEPRWSIEGCWAVDSTLADRSMFLTWENRSGNQDGLTTLVLRDLRTGQIIHTFFPDNVRPGVGPACSRGDSIACADAEGCNLLLASIADGAERIVPFEAGHAIYSCFLSNDGTHAIVSGRINHEDRIDWRIALIETATGKKLAEIPGNVERAEFTLDGQLVTLVVTDEDKQESFLKVWHVGKRDWMPEFESQSRKMASFRGETISPDGAMLLYSFRSDPETREWAIWNLHNGARFAWNLKGWFKPRNPTFSRDGRRLAAAHRDGEGNWFVDVWDRDARRAIFSCKPKFFARHAVLSPDGKRLAVELCQMVDTKTLVLFDLETGRRLWEKTDLLHPFLTEPGPTFSADGRTLVLYHSWRTPLHADIHEVETGKLLGSLHITSDDLIGNPSVIVLEGGRIQVVDGQYMPRPAWWRDWFGPILRLNDDGFAEAHVLDIDNRRVLARRRLEGDTIHFLSGGMMLSFASDGLTPGSVSCWDLRDHGPWRYVVGIPAALGGLIVGAAALRRRWRRKAPTAVGKPRITNS